MLAWLNALTKLPHCGSAGHSMPSGHGARRVQGRREQADERQDRDRHEDEQEQPAPEPQLAARDPHESDSRTSRWIGRIVTSTSTTSTMARADAVPTSRPTNARM